MVLDRCWCLTDASPFVQNKNVTKCVGHQEREDTSEPSLGPNMQRMVMSRFDLRPCLGSHQSSWSASCCEFPLAAQLEVWGDAGNEAAGEQQVSVISAAGLLSPCWVEQSVCRNDQLCYHTISPETVCTEMLLNLFQSHISMIIWIDIHIWQDEPMRHKEKTQTTQTCEQKIWTFLLWGDGFNCCKSVGEKSAILSNHSTSI